MLITNSLTSSTMPLGYCIKQKQLKCPIYQRHYEWDENNVEKLFNDISDDINDGLDGSDTYLSGIVINKTASNVYDIVDGQQRIITFILLCCGLKNYFNKNYHLHKENDDIYHDLIMYNGKIDEIIGKKGETKKISLISKDDEVLNKIIESVKNKKNIKDELSGDEENNNLYKCFCIINKKIDELLSSDISLLKVFDHINRIYITVEEFQISEIEARLMFYRRNMSQKEFSLIEQIRSEISTLIINEDKKEKFFLDFILLEKIFKNDKNRIKFFLDFLIKKYLFYPNDMVRAVDFKNNKNNINQNDLYYLLDNMIFQCNYYIKYIEKPISDGITKITGDAINHEFGYFVYLLSKLSNGKTPIHLNNILDIFFNVCCIYNKKENTMDWKNNNTKKDFFELYKIMSLYVLLTKTKSSGVNISSRVLLNKNGRSVNFNFKDVDFQNIKNKFINNLINTAQIDRQTIENYLTNTRYATGGNNKIKIILSLFEISNINNLDPYKNAKTILESDGNKMNIDHILPKNKYVNFNIDERDGNCIGNLRFISSSKNKEEQDKVKLLSEITDFTPSDNLNNSTEEFNTIECINERKNFIVKSIMKSDIINYFPFN